MYDTTYDTPNVASLSNISRTSQSPKHFSDIIINKASHSDVALPKDDTTSRPTSPLLGPMTRARAQAIHQEVNSLLSTYAFDTSFDGMLLHATTLCSIRYIGQDTSHGDQANWEGSGNEEDGDPTLQPELPPPRTRTSGQMPPRCPPAPRKKHPARTSAPGDRNFRPPELPPKFRPCSENAPKHRWMILQGNRSFPELGRKLAGTSGPQDRNFRPDAAKMLFSPQWRESSRNFRPGRPELPPTRLSAQTTLFSM